MDQWNRYIWLIAWLWCRKNSCALSATKISRNICNAFLQTVVTSRKLANRNANLKMRFVSFINSNLLEMEIIIMYRPRRKLRKMDAITQLVISIAPCHLKGNARWVRHCCNEIMWSNWSRWQQQYFRSSCYRILAKSSLIECSICCISFGIKGTTLTWNSSSYIWYQCKLGSVQ